MCAQYLVNTPIDKLAFKFLEELPFDFDSYMPPNNLFAPHNPAYVITSENGKRALRLMNFSLVPSWSKDPKVKFATHNARLDSVTEKASWKKPFITQHCLVPLTHFIEPIYLNKFAGNMVQFYLKNDEPLVAAGIFDTWVNRETGESIESFAILTDEPPKFVAETGHSRCPVFLKESAFDDWINPKTKDAKSHLDFLSKNKAELDLDASIYRPMTKGWEKRIPKPN